MAAATGPGYGAAAMFSGVPWQDVIACARNPRAARGQLLAYRDRRLRQLLAHAYARIPFYQHLWSTHPANWQAVRTAVDLPRLPLAERRAIRAEPPDRLLDPTTPPRRLIHHATSGTTEAVFTMAHTHGEMQLLRAFLYRAFLAQGLRCADHLARIWRTTARTRSDPWRKRLQDRLGLYRRSEVLWPQDPAAVAQQLRALRPTVLRSLPGALLRVAGALTEEERAGLAVRLLLVDGELLTPPVRHHLETRWRAPVRQFYGCSECMGLAWECPDCGLLHTFDDSVIVEVLQRDGQPALPGEAGHVVITSLHGRALPLIRYPLGDLAVQGPDRAPCGRPFGSLQAVWGRTSDTLNLAGGRTLHPFQIAALGEAVEGILEFQLVQSSPRDLALRVTSANGASEAARQRLEQRVQELAGPSVRVTVEPVADLPVSPSGKRRLVERL